jgi:hypothetical protein
MYCLIRQATGPEGALNLAQSLVKQDAPGMRSWTRAKALSPGRAQIEVDAEHRNACPALTCALVPHWRPRLTAGNRQWLEIRESM